MGVVYRAWDPTLECFVAIKLVSEETIPDESARRQLYTEARIASSLNHPNICRIKDVIEESGQAGIVMEFVEGQVLTHAIPAHVGLPFDVLAGLPKDIQPAHQVNPKAYEAYLQGRFEWNLRTTQSLTQAIS